MFDSFEAAYASAEIERSEVEAELVRHGATDWTLDACGRFLDSYDGTVIAAPDGAGYYAGADVLAWLGY